MAHPQHTPPLASLEEALTVLFCLTDDAYARINPKARSYESIKRLSDSEVITLALLQPLPGGGCPPEYPVARRGYCHLP